MSEIIRYEQDAMVSGGEIIPARDRMGIKVNG